MYIDVFLCCEVSRWGVSFLELSVLSYVHRRSTSFKSVFFILYLLLWEINYRVVIKMMYCLLY